jgi:predicted dehydrogenase
MKNLGVGIIGAGLIGKKRAIALQESGKGKLLAVADVNLSQAKSLAEQYGAEAFDSWQNCKKPEVSCGNCRANRIYCFYRFGSFKSR